MTISQSKIFQQAQNNLEVIFQSFLEWASDPNYYYQLLFTAIAIIASFFIAKAIRQKFPIVGEPKTGIKHSSVKWLLHRSGRLIHPTIALIFLAIFQQLSARWLENSYLIDSAQRISAVWFFWVIFNILVTNAILRMVSAWILIPAALLQIFGWLSATIIILEGYGFSIGKIQINAYTVVKAALFVSLLIWIGKFISNLVGIRIHKNKAISRSTRELLIKLFDILLYVILLIIALNLIGIDLTALAVFGGALGVGIGFGLQKIASNFISGIILLSEKSISINSLIEMDNGVSGYLRKFGARASIIETLDGKEVMIPNEDFITSRVANLTYSSNKGRIDIPVGVSYDTDLNLAHKLILESATNYEFAMQDEGSKPACYLREYADSSVNFVLTFWLVDVTKGRWGAKSDVMFSIWNKFKEHNIEIPFPQRDVHIRSGIENLKK